MKKRRGSMTSQSIKAPDKANLNPDKPMFPISVVADILKIHQRTLRIYDEEAILVPNRSPKNRRLYSLNDIDKGRFIQYLTRELGINLAGIKIIFHLLKQQKIDKNTYIEHIKKVANDLNITLEIQAENRNKLSKRGRKPSKSKV